MHATIPSTSSISSRSRWLSFRNVLSRSVKYTAETCSLMKVSLLLQLPRIRRCVLSPVLIQSCCWYGRVQDIAGQRGRTSITRARFETTVLIFAVSSGCRPLRPAVECAMKEKTLRWVAKTHRCKQLSADNLSSDTMKPAMLHSEKFGKLPWLLLTLPKIRARYIDCKHRLRTAEHLQY